MSRRITQEELSEKDILIQVPFGTGLPDDIQKDLDPYQCVMTSTHFVYTLPAYMAREIEQRLVASYGFIGSQVNQGKVTI